jgi:hypothetical protein
MSNDLLATLSDYLYAFIPKLAGALVTLTIGFVK